ncbi:MAG: hypothetical protein MUE68_05390 [Bacteroidetes bacterium]|jgi:anti-sigma factor RsiW|nr:hypothetical protein [Bacteroidota bacterium]
MNHLTPAQILQTVDGTADYATQAGVTSHLAVCPACRKEMEFQRALVRTVRRAPIPEVPDRFTRNVMSSLLPKRQNAATAWVLNNMGNVFALMAVLGVFWLVLSQPIAFTSTEGRGQADRLVEEWRQGISRGYAWMGEMLKSAVPSPPAEGSPKPAASDADKLALILVSLGALVVLDRLWLHRQRIRPKS